MGQEHDKLFRYTFAQPEHAASLLRTILPPALVQAITWSSLRPVSGSAVDEGLRARHADLLFEAGLGQGQVLLYLLLEHKSAPDRWTALQLLGYVAMALDRYRRERPERTSLPPIVPIVVHHGERPWSGPRSLAELIEFAAMPDDAARALLPLQPELHFVLDDLAAVPESQLRERRTTVLARLTLLLLQFVRQAEQRDPVELAQRWRDLLVALWDYPGSRPALLALFSYLASQIEADRDRLRAAVTLIHEHAHAMGKTIADQFREEGFRTGFDKGVDQGREQGISQGVTRGITEGQRDFLRRLLTRRFGPLPRELDTRITAADDDQLDRWADRLLSAPTLADVFA